MTTDTIGQGISLLDGNLTPHDLQLDDLEIEIYRCPNGSGIFHLAARCPQQCGPDCNHEHNFDLRGDTTTFGEVDGHLCPCARNINQQLGKPYRTYQYIIGGLQQTADIIDELHTNLREAATPTELEPQLADARHNIDDLERHVRKRNTNRQFTNLIDDQMRTYRNQYRNLQQQLSSDRDGYLRRISALLALPPTVTDANLTTTQLDNLTTDAHLLSSVFSHPNPGRLAARLRYAWLQQVTADSYQTQAAVDAIHTELHERHQPDDDAQAHTTCQQLTQRWEAILDQYVTNHAGQPRLVMLHNSITSHTQMPTPSSRTLQAFLARLPTDDIPLDGWTGHIIDQTETQLLQLVCPKTITDCGDATHLLQQADTADVNINDLLAMLPDDGGTTETGTNIALQAQAIMTALTS